MFTIGWTLETYEGGICDQLAGPDHEVDEISVTVVTDNYTDALRPDAATGRRYRAPAGTSLHAEHGLSYFIRASLSGRQSFMFDYGVDGRGVLNNIELFAVDPAKSTPLP